MTSHLGARTGTPDGREQEEENEIFKSPLQSFSIGSGEGEAGPSDPDKAQRQVFSAGCASATGFTSPVSFGSCSSSVSSPLQSASPHSLVSAPSEYSSSASSVATSSARCGKLFIRRATTSSCSIPTLQQPPSFEDKCAGGITGCTDLAPPSASSPPFSSPPFHGDGPSFARPALALTHLRRVPPVITSSGRQNTTGTPSPSSLPGVAPFVSFVSPSASSRSAVPFPLFTETSDASSPTKAADVLLRVGLSSSAPSCSSSSLDSFLSDARITDRTGKSLITGAGFSGVHSGELEYGCRGSRAGRRISPAFSTCAVAFSPVSRASHSSSTPFRRSTSAVSCSPQARASVRGLEVVHPGGFCQDLEVDMASPGCQGMAGLQQGVGALEPSKSRTEESAGRDFDSLLSGPQRCSSVEKQAEGQLGPAAFDGPLEALQLTTEALCERGGPPVTPFFPSIDTTARDSACVSPTSFSRTGSHGSSEFNLDADAVSAFSNFSSEFSSTGRFSKQVLADVTSRSPTGRMKGATEGLSAVTGREETPSRGEAKTRKPFERSGTLTEETIGCCEKQTACSSSEEVFSESRSPVSSLRRLASRIGVCTLSPLFHNKGESEHQGDEAVVDDNACVAGLEGGRVSDEEQREMCLSLRPVSLPETADQSPPQSFSCPSPPFSPSSSNSSHLCGSPRQGTYAKNSDRKRETAKSLAPVTLTLPLSRRTVSLQTSLRRRRLILKVSPFTPDSRSQRQVQEECWRAPCEVAVSPNCDALEKNEKETVVSARQEEEEEQLCKESNVALLPGGNPQNVQTSSGIPRLDSSAQGGETVSGPGLQAAVNYASSQSTLGQTDREGSERVGEGVHPGKSVPEEEGSRQARRGWSEVCWQEEQCGVSGGGHGTESLTSAQGEEETISRSEADCRQEDDPESPEADFSLYPSLVYPAEEGPLQCIDTSPASWVPVVFRVFDKGGSLCWSCRRALLCPSETSAGSGAESANRALASLQLPFSSASAISTPDPPLCSSSRVSSYVPSFSSAEPRPIGLANELNAVILDFASRLSGNVRATRASSTLPTSSGSLWPSSAGFRVGDEFVPRTFPAVVLREEGNSHSVVFSACRSKATPATAEFPGSCPAAEHGPESDDWPPPGSTSGGRTEQCSCSALYVVGSHRLLGSWKQKSGVRLRTSPALYPYYVSPPVLLPRHIRAIGYKFARLSKPHAGSSPSVLSSTTEADILSPSWTTSSCKRSNLGTGVDDTDALSVPVTGRLHDSWFGFPRGGGGGKVGAQEEHGAWQVELVSGERRLKLPQAAAVISHTFGMFGNRFHGFLLERRDAGVLKCCLVRAA